MSSPVTAELDLETARGWRIIKSPFELMRVSAPTLLCRVNARFRWEHRECSIWHSIAAFDMEP